MTQIRIEVASKTFPAAIGKETVAVLYFGGFGLQVAHRSYLVPVNAQIWNEADIRRDGISIDAMIQREASEVGGAGSTQTDLILLTHTVREGRMMEVITQMQSLPTVLAPITRIRKEELA